MRTCLICDDHALVREALTGTVQLNWPDVSVSQAGDFPGAWRLARDGPDFVIADLVMPGADPLQGIAGIMQAAPGTPVLVVTGTEDDALLLNLLRAGVAGFAPKSASGAVIEAAIRLILVGGRYLPPRLADLAASRVDSATPKDIHIIRDPSLSSGGTSHGPPAKFGPSPADGLFGPLTSRQIDVLKLVAAGQSNKEIARTLGLAPSTVKTHLEHLLSALGVSNRTEASNKARSLKIF